MWSDPDQLFYCPVSFPSPASKAQIVTPFYTSLMKYVNIFQTAVPFDLASLPDLRCSPALRPLVHGAAGDEKHDPLKKIYVRSALSRSLLDSATVYAASGLWLFCIAKGNAVLTPLFYRFQYQKGPLPENSFLLFCPFFPSLVSRIPCAPNFFTLFACIYWFIWKEHLFIHV